MESDQTQLLHSPPQTIITPSPALSQTSTVFGSTPKPPRQRATFARLASVDDGRYTAIKNNEDDITEATPYNDDHDTQHSQSYGLGISVIKDGRMDSAPNTAGLKNGFGISTHQVPLWSPKSAMKPSAYSSQASLPQHTAYEPDIQRLRNRRSFADSLRMVYDGEFSTKPLSLACFEDRTFTNQHQTLDPLTVVLLINTSTTVVGIGSP